MDIKYISQLDSYAMLGIMNAKLRLVCENLEELEEWYQSDLLHVKRKLFALGYSYDPIRNQFRAY